MTYDTDMSFSEACMPEVKKILGSVFFRKAPKHLDQQRNTDLIVLTAGDMQIACRIRRAWEIQRSGLTLVKQYPYDVTFRSSRDNGTETELSKMLGGYGTHMFYGFGDVQHRIVRWVILDLHAVRSLVGADGFAKIREVPVASGQKFKPIDIRRNVDCVLAHDPMYFGAPATPRLEARR